MPTETFTDRARGCLAGLAIGDALGQPTEGWTVARIREKWGYITDYLTDDPGGSDDTEYAVFGARNLLKYGRGITSQQIADEWREHVASQRGGFKGAGFSEMMAIHNLRAGINPPACGDHLHSWSDGLAMRVSPFGIVSPGNPEEAARLSDVDGVVSHAGEGLVSGRAVAAAVACAMVEGTVEECIDVALSVIPADSWTARAIVDAVEIGNKAKSVKDAIDPLSEAIVCHYYPWADLGPEAVGLSFGVLAASGGDFEEAVLGGVNIGRDTDTIAAIAGTVLGARLGYSRLPARWANRIQSIKGLCIRTVAGVDLIALADELVEMTENEVLK